MTELLKINNLKTYFYSDSKEIKAVDGVSFEIQKGETVALVGESGSGKSITSLSIMQLLPQRVGKIIDGEILFGNVNLATLSDSEMNRIRGNEISMIFQEPMTSLNPVLTIGNQLTEIIMTHTTVTKREALVQAIELLKSVGFSRANEMVDEYPDQLSGGMRQRVMIAMAMANKPALLIADEPTTALDVTIQAQILELMRELKETTDTSILLITHDLGVVAEMADRVIVMYGGQIVEETDVYSLFKSPKHPYTIGLLRSIPRIDDTRKRLDSITGSVPPAHSFPVGCRFASRCEFATDECKMEIPELRSIKAGHRVRCILVKEGS